MKEMARENEEAEAEYARKQEELLARHAPFSGQGHSLTAPSPTPATPTAVSHAHWSPVTLDPAKPSGNIQVGSVMMMLNWSLLRNFSLSTPCAAVSCAWSREKFQKLQLMLIIMMNMVMTVMMAQVRLAEGGRMVIKLNTDHTVAHIKQEIMARYGIA